MLFWDLDFDFQTLGAGYREENSSIIRIGGPNLLLLSSIAEQKGNTENYPVMCFGDNSVSLRPIWTKLGEILPTGASYIAQGRQKQPEIIKN